MFPNHSSCSFQEAQRGAALVVAIFIITVMAILATVIARVITTSELSSVDEIYGIRAYHAATSGAQLISADLINALESEDNPTSICNEDIANENLTHFNFDTPGLQRCRAEVRCTLINHNDFNVVQYQISSIGRCQSAQQSYSRVLSVEVVDGQF